MIPVISILGTFGLPAFALWRSWTGRPLKRAYLFSLGSFVFCASGIIAELFTVRRRLLHGDISGIEDTIDAVLIICAALVLFTAILNFMLLALNYEESE